jgi:hypothetical protein
MEAFLMASDIHDLPELPAELEGAMSDLGRFRAEHRAGWGLLLYLLLGLVLLVLGAAGTVFLVMLVFDDEFHAGFAKLFVLSIALTIGGAFMCFRSVRAWGVRVLVFERCIVYLKGANMRVFGWQEIASFEHQSPKGFWGKLTQSSYWMTIRRSDGAELTIDAYVNGAKELGSHVAQELAQRKANAATEPVGEEKAG